MRRLLAVAIVLATSLAVSVSQAAAQSPQPSAGCSRTPMAERFIASFPVDGVQRTALVNVPAAATGGKPLPLAFMFHGAGGTGQGTEAYTGLTQVATSYGFIMVYPNANGKYWNISGGGSQGNDDVQFVSSLLDQLEGVLCIDQRRVYGAGVSNGGGFVARVGCELSGRLSAIASVAGLYGREPACPPSRPLSVLEMHGTADQTVPYDGLPTRAVASVWSFLVKWEQWDSCPSGAPSWQRLAAGALLESKPGCAHGTQVLHVRLRGEPHAWPAKSAGSPVKFDASTAILQFFARGRVLPQ